MTATEPPAGYLCKSDVRRSPCLCRKRLTTLSVLMNSKETQLAPYFFPTTKNDTERCSSFHRTISPPSARRKHTFFALWRFNCLLREPNYSTKRSKFTDCFAVSLLSTRLSDVCKRTKAHYHSASPTALENT